MESVVDLTKLLWEIQSIRHLANPGIDPEWPNVSRTQLPPLSEVNHTLLG